MTTEIGGFEERGERVYHCSQRSRAEWMGRSVEEEEVDPRIEFVRQLVFAYMYHLIAAPEKLAEFEQMLLETLFADDDDDDYELEKLDPLIFVRNFPRPAPISMRFST